MWGGPEQGKGLGESNEGEGEDLCYIYSIVP